jgi:hypothetical protein
MAGRFAPRVPPDSRSERHWSHPHALGARRGTRVPRTRDPTGTEAVEPGRDWSRPHRRRRQGYRGQALRVRFSRREHARLAVAHFARAAAPGRGCDPCLHRSRLVAAKRSAEASRNRDCRRSRGDGNPSSRVLRRRSFVPGRQNSTLSRPTDRSPGLRGFRYFRSGALGAARPRVHQVRRRNRPRGDAELRGLPFHPYWRPYAGGGRRLLAGQERLGQSRQVRESSSHRGADLVSAADFGRASLCRSGRLRRANPCRPRGGQSGASGSRPRIRHPVGRPDVSRARKWARVVRLERQDACAGPRRPVAL